MVPVYGLRFTLKDRASGLTLNGLGDMPHPARLVIPKASGGWKEVRGSYHLLSDKGSSVSPTPNLISLVGLVNRTPDGTPETIEGAILQCEGDGLEKIEERVTALRYDQIGTRPPTELFCDLASDQVLVRLRVVDRGTERSEPNALVSLSWACDDVVERFHAGQAIRTNHFIHDYFSCPDGWSKPFPLSPGVYKPLRGHEHTYGHQSFRVLPSADSPETIQSFTIKKEPLGVISARLVDGNGQDSFLPWILSVESLNPTIAFRQKLLIRYKNGEPTELSVPPGPFRVEMHRDGKKAVKKVVAEPSKRVEIVCTL